MMQGGAGREGAGGQDRADDDGPDEFEGRVAGEDLLGEAIARDEEEELEEALNEAAGFGRSKRSGEPVEPAKEIVSESDEIEA